MHTEEKWRPIADTNGRYEVSNLGRVRTVPHVIQSGDRTRRIPHRIRVLTPAPNGYLTVNLGKGYKRSVHRLVAEAFIGPRPDGMETCHNNGDQTDNRANNLRYDTLSANRLDTVRHGNNPQANKTHCPAGHLYDEANTFFKKGHPTWRFCRTCHRDRERERWRRRVSA